ncbi:glycoside hydrolase family 16 protein [Shewanella salipaludis]|uniref:Glycoside hydrolase family 16 protein n=1 Tax=Shewanella salipaludis TaxID=2723052 RepID=A0A972FYU3_9GAMM|nr:glycoside hydrolase family 16 protein [Shewanella salipaludis]NMH65728.1 glycoside hydrolase family 16 protein [Shewanella salipaludis]
MSKTIGMQGLGCIVASLLMCGCNHDTQASPAEKQVVAEVPSAAAAGGWHLVWQDEFDTLDMSKWSFEVNCYGGGNSEQQCYTDRVDNAFVEQGMLNIVAKREDFQGPAKQESDPGYDPADTSASMPYTSARLRSMNKGDWKYGRFEIRAKLPRGQGSWPAIWMLPTDYVYGGWAASGEIDIMEAVNLGTTSDRAGAEAGERESRIHATLHYGRAWPQNVYSGLAYRLPNDVSPADDFHVYALEWEKDEIRWYVDGVHYATQRSSGWYSQYLDTEGKLVNGMDDAPYNQKFHMLLNLAVGGSWPGNANDKGIDESVFPQTLSIDYVRAYECSVAPSTGQGCATIGDDAILQEGNQPPVIAPGDDSIGAGPIFELFDDALAAGLQLNSYNPDGEIAVAQVAESGRGDVLSVSKTGTTGNIYFGYAPRVDLSHFAAAGELVFDLNLLSAAQGTELLVKLDSGWPNVSDYSVTLPAVGQWTEIRIPIATILAGGNRFSPGAGANIASILNPFVVEPLGPMQLKLDNIRIEYHADSATELVIYDDQDKAPFALAAYAASGNVVLGEVDVGGEHGNVRSLNFNTNEAVAYFQSAEVNDIGSFERLNFDLYVEADPRASRDFVIKMDCVFPCGSGDYPITSPEIGSWSHYSIPLSELVSHPGSTLDLSRVDTPLVVFPAWGNQQGVVLLVDNVRLTKS